MYKRCIIACVVVEVMRLAAVGISGKEKKKSVPYDFFEWIVSRFGQVDFKLIFMKYIVLFPMLHFFLLKRFVSDI